MSEGTDMTDQWLSMQDLAAFARETGQGILANGLWRMIEGELSWRSEQDGYPGLTLRCAGTDMPWSGDCRFASEVSRSSLLAARAEVYPRMMSGYGPSYHALFCQWVDSLR